jgi:hypothetical protein
MAVRASAAASPTAPKRFKILNFIAFRIISIAVLLRHVFSTWLFDSLWSLNGLELGFSLALAADYFNARGIISCSIGGHLRTD